MGEKYQYVEKSLHHENLPQILGYSDGKAPTPFILLASAQSRDLASAMRSALATRNLADYASLILETYRDIALAIAHTQQQLSLSKNDAQDFIDHATYSIDSNNIIVRLPLPREGWVTARSYCLDESLAERALQYLKELMNAEEAALQFGPCQSSASLNTHKQPKGLLHSLLRRRREGPCLSPELEDLLDDAGEDNPLTLALCGRSALTNHGTTSRGVPALQSAPLQRVIAGTSQEVRQTLQTSYVSEISRKAKIAARR